MKARTGKARRKIYLRRIARRRGYGKVFWSYRRDLAGNRRDRWDS